MKRNYLFLAAVFVLTARAVAGAQVEPLAKQQMGDFSLSGFSEKGNKTWDLMGQQADISFDTIKLNNIESNFYGDQDTLKLTARQGDFDRREGNLHVENDVVITTASGTRLTTNALDWDRKKEFVSTKEAVNISKGDMVMTGQGAQASVNLSKVNVEKDVQVNIANAQGPAKAATGDPLESGTIVINCDGPLEMDYPKNLATFTNNVKVQTPDGLILSNSLLVYFSKKQNSAGAGTFSEGASQIEKIIARGNVTITRGENISYSEEAVYSMAERKITLSGKPKLVIYQPEALDAPVGN